VRISEKEIAQAAANNWEPSLLQAALAAACKR
jgi:hypothetical protein